jgi:hypothetical protein
VIPTQLSFDNVTLLFPKKLNWEKWKQQKSDIPFSDSVVEFLNALSSLLLKDKGIRNYTDIVTFAFFCRKANILTLKKEHSSAELRLGRGILFHVAPSNVPINFAYSLVAGLLSGNRNIVRVSAAEFPQVDIVARAIALLSEQYHTVTDRIVLVRYERSSNATTVFSAFCDVRIIWGGDETIAQIRQSPIPPRSFDVTFADRYSLAVINADELIHEPEMKKLAASFYNDTYLFDQNACSAPHLLIWLGNRENIQAAQEKFWNSVHKVVREKYELQPALAVNKLTAFYRQAVAMPVKKETSQDNLVWRVVLEKLPDNIDEFRCAGGYFTEFIASSIDEIAPIIKNKYQTLGYYGIKRDFLTNFVIGNRLPGLDRLVPIGETTSFALTWDGYDLIKTLTRRVSVM